MMGDISLFLEAVTEPILPRPPAPREGIGLSRTKCKEHEPGGHRNMNVALSQPPVLLFLLVTAQIRIMIQIINNFLAVFEKNQKI